MCECMILMKMMIGCVERMNCVSGRFRFATACLYLLFTLISPAREGIRQCFFFSHSVHHSFLQLYFFLSALSSKLYKCIHLFSTVAVLPLLDQSEFSHVSFFPLFSLFFVRVSIGLKLFISISTDWFILHFISFISFGNW